MKKINLVILCLFFVVTLTSCTHHIADTNGKDDFSLTTIPVQNIVDGNDCIKRGAVKIQKGKSGVIKVKKFSGVDTLHKFQLNSASLHLEIDPKVNSGNMKLLLCTDNEVVSDILLNNGPQVIDIPVSADTIYLKVGGESANFYIDYEYEITMSKGIYI